MTYKTEEISGKKGWKDFLSVPLLVYRNDPNWVAPQDSETRRVLDAVKNPYFRDAVLNLYVCYCDNRPVCRSVMVINHHHWVRWNRKSAFFGFFESVNDIGAVTCLFERIEADARASGAEFLEGPFNPNHYSEIGILSTGFGTPAIFFETYNPHYYPVLLESMRFSELKRLHTRINANIGNTIARGIRWKDKSPDDKNITIRKLKLLHLGNELELMREINNDAFKDNWYFLPLTREEYKFSAKYLFFVTWPGLVLFAEYKGKPAAVMQCVVNFNKVLGSFRGKLRPWHIPAILLKRRKLGELVVFSIGIKKEYRTTSVSSALLNAAMKLFRNFNSLSTTWTTDDNIAIIHFGNLLGMKPHKYFSVYSKSL